MADSLSERRILLAVGGGIAAYKAAELTRLFIKAGASVRVLMTDAAQKFITPLTLQTLSQHPVAIDVFDLQQESTIGHIALADWAELFVVAPATADLIAKLAHGLAGDVVTTCALATRAPMLIAPAMNVNMWEHAAVKDNMRVLVARGCKAIGPALGDLACGWIGAGRMSEPAEIVAAAAANLGARPLAGKRVLITAGPTWEAIDPVRVLTNRSTGKMGFAIAAAAASAGAKVTLVAGPVALSTPAGVDRVDVESAADMLAAVMTRANDADAIIKTAAVSDQRPATRAPQKVKKSASEVSLSLVANTDILATLGAHAFVGKRPLLVGFAAETQDVATYARKKLTDKKLDLVVANDVSEAGSGFGGDTNRVTIVRRDGVVDHWPRSSKAEVAQKLIALIAELLT
jgi:phosphopantothenoylcysteine decarboxylase/phosphopantothenate--cysteine ligase